MCTIYFFGKGSSIFLFLIWPNLGPFALLRPFGDIFKVGIRFKNFFRTYQCAHSTLVLEVQLYLFVLNLAIFGAPFAVFCPLGLFLGSGSCSKNFWNLCSQSTFVLEAQPHLFVFNSAKFWASFALFGPLGAIFWVGVKFKNCFWAYLHRVTTFILEVQLYLASLKLYRVGVDGWGVIRHCDFNENQVVSF